MKDLRLMYPRIFKLVQEENIRQLAKWGVQDKHPMEWMIYLTEEVGELAAAISDDKYGRGPKENVVKEAIQAATLALKIAEMFQAEVEKERI